MTQSLDYKTTKALDLSVYLSGVMKQKEKFQKV